MLSLQSSGRSRIACLLLKRLTRPIDGLFKDTLPPVSAPLAVAQVLQALADDNRQAEGEAAA